MFDKQTVSLLPPKVLSHNPSGIGDVDVSDPTKRMEVLVGPIKLSQKDKLELYWGMDTNPVDTYTHTGPNDTNGFFSLFVATNFIEPGPVSVYYVLTSFPSGLVETSESTKVLIKLSIPGGRDPNPASFYENENLEVIELSPPGIIIDPSDVTATLGAYENMSVGDRITLSWHGEFIHKTILTEDEIGQSVVLPVSKEIIELAGDSDMIEVRYEVRDVVNNWSRWSLATYVDVEAGQSRLSAPIVPQAPDMELDLDKLSGAAVQVLVLSQPEIEVGDEVTLMVERSTAEGMALETYSASRKIETTSGFTEFLVPNEEFQPIAQGRARLKYTIVNATGESLRSKSLPLKIVGNALELSAPRLPVAEQNNGVLDPAAQNVIVEVPPYYFMADGNDVNMVWIGKSATGANVMHEELKNLNSGDVGKTLSFLIPDQKVSALAGGTLEIHYTVTTFAKAFFKSPVLQLTVGDDSSIALPAPTVDGVGSDGVLDPAGIVLEAIVRIAPYSMNLEDKVTLHWDGQGSSGSYTDSTVINSGMLGKEVSFRVNKSYIEASINSGITVWYEVDRNNQKFLSEQLRFSVGNVVYPDLPTPTIKEATADILDPAAALNGATVVIDVAASLNAGDKVDAYWIAPKGSDHKEIIVTPEHANSPIEVIFAAALVSVNDGQTVEVSYSVTRTSGIVQASPVLHLNVLSAALELPAPTMDTVGADGILRPSLIPESGATVRVGYRDMKTGDNVLLRWTGASAADAVVQTVGSETQLLFTLPRALIVASEGGTASVQYFVNRDGVDRDSEVLALTVKSGLELDTSSVILGGKVYLLPGTPDLLPAFPTGTTVKRVASGGQPPYAYSSSDPKIAHVDGEGLVSVRKVGAAVITATDAAGESKAYNVSVTGVIECSGVGFGNLTQIANAANAAQMRLPTIHELVEIYNAYAGRWPMGNGNYWSSTVAKDVFGAKWYYVKDLSTGKDYKLLHINGALGVALR